MHKPYASGTFPGFSCNKYEFFPPLREGIKMILFISQLNYNYVLEIQASLSLAQSQESYYPVFKFIYI